MSEKLSFAERAEAIGAAALALRAICEEISRHVLPRVEAEAEAMKEAQQRFQSQRTEKPRSRFARQ
jgi:hypothetical protein